MNAKIAANRSVFWICMADAAVVDPERLTKESLRDHSKSHPSEKRSAAQISRIRFPLS
jgi:hypothetical protein